VPSYGERRRLEIAAPPEACFAALLDVEGLPAWQRALRSAAVLARDADGRPVEVEYVVDARVRTVRYRIRQAFAEAPLRITSTYVGGDFRDFGGEWRFEPLAADRTCVTLDLRIDPGRFVPGPVRALIADAVMRSALQDLKAHLE
jgi:ribosome-associated toxin RatA of RatAB toxin-antitoxin module